MAPNPNTARITKLQATLQKGQALLISRRSDIFYFSSFVANVPEERSAFLLITAKESHLLLQNFLPDPENFPGLVSHGFTSPNRLAEYIAELVKRKMLASLQVDLSDLRVDEFQALQKVPGLEITSLERQSIWKLRRQKDETEISKIKKAMAITKQVLLDTLEELRVGQSELEVARLIEQKIRAHAGCDLAFPSIIAFDEHTALPHNQPGNKKLHHGSVVLIDIGATFENYCADMTRTIFWRQSGQSDTPNIQKKFEHFKHIEQLVKSAYKKAEDLLQANNPVTAADLDLACRNFLTNEGYAQQFIHTTGHGLGLDIHEPPSLYHNNPQVLLPGMVITIEPGIYLPGEFGIRWENTVVVK